LTPPPDDEHDCGWKAYAEAQSEKLAELSEKVAALERLLAGKKSEKRKGKKLPPPVPPQPNSDESKQKRKSHSAQREANVETVVIPVPVPPAQAGACPQCGSEKLRSVGDGKPSILWEYVHAHFRKRVHLRQTLSCRCGHIVTAPAPERIGDKVRYAPSFVAHLIVSKCCFSIPQYRLEKAHTLVKSPVSRSTMCSLFHRGAEELSPIADAMLELIPEARDVHADETSMRQQDLAKRAFLWAFVTHNVTLYRYATTRSGSVPLDVLGDSPGRLVVDQYTGYNVVTKPGRRVRAGCLAHARRKLFELSEHPETAEALDLIRDIYLVEDEARRAGILGTPAHLELRQRKSRPLFARLLCWGHKHRPRYNPKSRMAKAINYLLNHFRELGCFLRFASIPPDNNKAEASLRRVALGRSNFLFVGNENAGRNLAVLYSLVTTCEQNGVNPIEYLTDVLTRVQRHPQSRISELLPQNWKPPDSHA